MFCFCQRFFCRRLKGAVPIPFGLGIRYLLLTFLIFPCAVVDAQTKKSEQDVLAATLSKTFETTAKRTGFSGSLLVDVHGKIICRQSIGEIERGKSERVTPETLFELGSATKPFTAITCLLLQEQGKLDLDASISKYLPNVPADCEKITVRHLLQHTSGIPGTNYGPHTNDVSVATPIYLKGGPRFEPGIRHEYWNQGYSLLSAIIAKTGGGTYESVTRDLIFDPLKMNASCFVGEKKPASSRAAIGFSTYGKPRSALAPPYGDFYGMQYKGMGGIVSNVDNVHKLIRALLEKKVLSKDMRQEMLDNSKFSYGLGWTIEDPVKGQRRVYHIGSVRGFLASVIWYPDDDSCMILLSNSDDKSSFFETENLCKSALESTFIVGTKLGEFENGFIDSITGLYVLDERTVVVKPRGNQLDMQINWGGAVTNGRLERDSKGGIVFIDSSPNKLSIETEMDGSTVKSLTFFNQTYKRKR